MSDSLKAAPRHTTLLEYFFAMVWLINGLYCKVLDQVPRHRVIIGRILGIEYERFFTVLIGIAEIVMSIWILSGLWIRLNRLVQIVVIILMNVIERILVPDLLLFGSMNIVFAVMFCVLIYADGFILRSET